MAQENTQKQKKQNSIWFQLSLNTFQGRITIPFIAILMIGAALFFVANSLWQKVENTKNQIIENILPVQTESAQLLNLLKRNEALLYDFLFSKEVIKKETAREMWLVEIATQKDALKSALFKLNIEEGKTFFITLNRQLSELSQAQEKVIQLEITGQKTEVVAYQVNSDYKLLNEESEKTIRKIINFAQIKTQKMNDSANTEKNQFILIMIIGTFIWFFGSYGVGILMFTGIFKWIKEIRNHTKEMAYGNIPEYLDNKKFNNEFRGIVKDLNLLCDNFSALKDYSEAVGQENFNMSTKIFGSKSMLGKSLTEMSVSLQKVNELEYMRNWTAEGLAKFAQIQQKNTQNIQGLCRDMIAELVKYMKAVQGGFFLINKDTQPYSIDLIASYAFGKEKFFKKHIDIEEGLLGRAYTEKKSVHLKEIPKNYIELSSGLGDTTPKTLIITPLINDDGQVQGIFELSLMDILQEYQILFLEKLANSTASFITVVLAGEKNRQLLEESQKITSSLRIKEEETRLSALELSKAQEEIDLKLKETKREYEKLNGVLSHIPEGVIIMDADGQIEVFNRAAVKMFKYEEDNILGRNIRLILPSDYLTDAELNDDRENAPLKAGIEKNLKAIKKDGSQFEVEASFSLVEINQEKLITAILRDI
ncbi:MAG: PAS domain S-box protein [Bacteroidetes bacterium]|nr:MAG: PAS domain S-box protein [Bacteroidota bacterium]TAG85642.1 MAG: PAS domain S-box protein [Bacteroidota bacterium]